MGVSLRIKDINYLNFDLRNKTKIKGIEGDIFVVNYKLNSGREENFSFFICRNINNDFINPILIKSFQVKSVEYGLINTGQILSVYIFVQTAFLPQTAVAIAASCAIGNCIQ